MERELLAIIRALQHFRQITQGAKINIFCGNRNLSFDSCPENNRVQRWKLLLNEYNCNISHIPRSENNGADYLSKLLNMKSNPENNNTLNFNTNIY